MLPGDFNVSRSRAAYVTKLSVHSCGILPAQVLPPMLHPSALCVRTKVAKLIWDHQKTMEVRTYRTHVSSTVWVGIIESGTRSVTGIVKFFGRLV